jgi:hypothetical protein
VWGCSPRRRIQDSGTRVREPVSFKAFARPAVLPRHSPNHRPSRRTRKSVRPALEAESQIEPWFATRDPSACTRPIGAGAEARRTMPKKQKKTALRNPSRRKVSPDSKSGLIVTEKNAEQSAGTECVLDNRSHRTPSAKLKGFLHHFCRHFHLTSTECQRCHDQGHERCGSTATSSS